jgi:hypothetical protein
MTAAVTAPRATAAAALQPHRDAVAALGHLAWEFVHTGPWHAVPDAWRDAHALAALLAVAFQLSDADDPDKAPPPASAESPLPLDALGTAPAPAPEAPATATEDVRHLSKALNAEQVLRAALRRIDVALLIGGPRLAPHLHRAVDALSMALRAHEDVRGNGCDAPAADGLRSGEPAAAAGRGAASQDQHARRDASARDNARSDASECWHQDAVAARAAAAAAAGRVCTLVPLPAVQGAGMLPFEVQYLRPGVPGLFTGLLDAWPALNRCASASLDAC